MKGFKYHITMTVLLYKHKINGDIQCSPAYFNSATKTVINFEYYLDKSFQEILYRIDNWLNKGSGWITESVDGEYVNISAYSPLIGSPCIVLPSGLKNSKKGLINIRNKCLLWCHIRHLNLVEKNPQRIKNKINKLLIGLIMKELNFLFQKMIIVKLKDKTIFALMCFIMKVD